MTTAVHPTFYKRAQSRVFHVLEGDVAEPAARFCEIFIAGLVVLNVLAIILESVPDIHEEWGEFFHYFDLFSVGVFSIEYVLRVWSYGQKLLEEGGTAWQGRNSYIFSFFGLVDFFQHRAVLFATLVAWHRLACPAHVPFASHFQTVSLQQRHG